MSDIVRKSVASSNIRAIGYNEETQVLEVEFFPRNRRRTSGGRVYSYAKVPKAMYEALMAAESHGKYFHTHIKGQFETTRPKGETL